MGGGGRLRQRARVIRGSQRAGPGVRWFPGRSQEAGFRCGLGAAGQWGRFASEYLHKSFLEGIHLSGAKLKQSPARKHQSAALLGKAASWCFRGAAHTAHVRPRSGTGAGGLALVSVHRAPSRPRPGLLAPDTVCFTGDITCPPSAAGQPPGGQRRLFPFPGRAARTSEQVPEPSPGCDPFKNTNTDVCPDAETRGGGGEFPLWQQRRLRERGSEYGKCFTLYFLL